MPALFSYLIFSIFTLFGIQSKSGDNSNTHRQYDKFYHLYDALQLKSKGLSEIAYKQALEGWIELREKNLLSNMSRLAIADFSLSANTKRLFLIDVESAQLLLQTYVAHGRNTGNEYAEKFSNTPGSFQSSPGFYLTGETYQGNHGYSLKLNGLQKGINDLALDRAIVIHGADYVSESFIKANGRLGRSLGCPAVPENQASQIIDEIKGGACFYIYSPGTPGI